VELKRVLAADCLVDPAQLLPVELAGTAGDRLCTKSIESAFAIPREPLVDHGTSIAERPNHRFGTFPRLDLLNGSDANLFLRRST